MPTRTGEPSASLLLASLTCRGSVGMNASAVGVAFGEEVVVRFVRLGLGVCGSSKFDLASDVLDAKGRQTARTFIVAVLRTRHADGFLDRVKECVAESHRADRGRRPPRD